MTLEQKKIGFIGAGNMARSLVGGLLATKFPANQIWLSDPHEAHVNEVMNQFSVNASTDNTVVANQADILVFCVKPQILQTVAREIHSIVSEKKPLLISIAAGIPIRALSAWLNASQAIVRCMPNTPALVHCGASALFANEHVTQTQHQDAESLLRAVGLTVWVNDEKQIDSATALSGSGPAYFFLVMEALENGAKEMGLDDAAAQLLTRQTALGAARMALKSQNELSQLREQVTSPGGTTQAALDVLLDNDIPSIFKKALQAAKKRAEELAKMYGNDE